MDDRLTLADLAVASPFVNMQHLGIRLDAGKYPKTAAFVQAMLTRPSFAALIVKEKLFLSR